MPGAKVSQISQITPRHIQTRTVTVYHSSSRHITPNQIPVPYLLVPHTLARRYVLRVRQFLISQGLLNSRIYTVQAGDTLQAIASRELGQPQAWPALLQLNDLDKPEHLQVGQEILLPTR